MWYNRVINKHNLKGTKMKTNVPKINRELAKISQIHWQSIPLDDIYNIVEKYAGKIDQDNRPLILCADNSSCSIPIANISRKHLQLAWYRMSSGKYEVNA